MEISTIQCSEKTKKKLKELGKMGDSYEDVMKMLIDFYEKNKK